jgi:excisionase family DNA binding protein
MTQQILNLSEVAEMLSVSKETIRRWAVSKLIPAFKLHKRGQWKFKASEVDKFIQERQAENAPEQGRSASSGD